MYEYRARLHWRSNGRHPVYDGDTVHLSIDLGFGVWINPGRVRLAGIDAPEIRGPERAAGIAARDYLRARLAEHDEFTVRTLRDRRGKYGRYLVEIWLGDVNLNDEMVLLGHAVAV